MGGIVCLCMHAVSPNALCNLCHQYFVNGEAKLVHCPVSKIWPNVIRLLQSTITCLLHCMYGFTSVVPIVAVANTWDMICLLFPLDYLCIGKNW